ncbi:MAG: hypothetical protein D3924_10835, partial [Candidatus Electrothrix sp. AR4]|nr:hypothetical protein [Candidatus Electrothrix sp. AR4]
QMLAGIDAEGNGVCVQSPLFTLTANCPEGEYVSGWDQGALICTTFPQLDDSSNVIVSPVTGRIWAAADLGQPSDAVAGGANSLLGDFYQWGRGNDGHSHVTSLTSVVRVSSYTDTSPYFITVTPWFNGRYPTQDWHPTTNPCRPGFSVPTEADFRAEYPSGYHDPMHDHLNLVMDGYRSYNNADVRMEGTAHYWLRRQRIPGIAKAMVIPGFTQSEPITIHDLEISHGLRIRCIKDQPKKYPDHP